MYQKLIVVGRLARDGEMKVLPNGDPTLSFSMATDRTWNDRNGQRQKETTWWRVTIFGKIAQSLNEYLVKGAAVAVEGRLRVDPKSGGPVVYQKRDGTHTASFEILADQIRLVHSPKWSTAGSDSGGSGYAEDVPF